MVSVDLFTYLLTYLLTTFPLSQQPVVEQLTASLSQTEVRLEVPASGKDSLRPDNNNCKLLVVTRAK